MKQDRFQDKEGNNRSVVRVIANRIEFLDSKGSGQQNNQSQQQRGQAPAITRLKMVTTIFQMTFLFRTDINANY